MRPRLSVALIGGVIVVLAVAWLFRPKAPVTASDGVAQLTRDDESQISNSTNAAQPSPVRNSHKDSKASNPPTSGAVETERAKGAIEWYKQQIHRPIEFYGKVVDENTQAVQGATVEFSCNRYFPPEGSTTITKTSDSGGLFSLSGVMGSTLGIHVSKEGYYPIKSQNQEHFDYVGTGGTPFLPLQSDPVIFHLRKKGTGANLTTSRSAFSSDIQFDIPRDGSIVRVDMLNKKVGTEGQLELSSLKPLRGQPASDWSFRISVPGGGLVEQNDEFPFEAPETGYRTTIEYKFKPGDTNWTERLQKHFYIVFGEPRRYGRIDVRTEIDRGVILSYVINLDGSRNLEPK